MHGCRWGVPERKCPRDEFHEGVGGGAHVEGNDSGGLFVDTAKVSIIEFLPERLRRRAGEVLGLQEGAIVDPAVEQR